MFESQTETVILNRMLEKVPASMDKREGSIIFDASMPAAIEFMLLYATLDWFLKNTFGDTAEREYLIETAKERGLSPYPATYAEGNGTFTPSDIVVPVGSRFSYDDVNYTVIESSAGAARLFDPGGNAAQNLRVGDGSQAGGAFLCGERAVRQQAAAQGPVRFYNIRTEGILQLRDAGRAGLQNFPRDGVGVQAGAAERGVQPRDRRFSAAGTAGDADHTHGHTSRMRKAAARSSRL